MSIRNLLTMKQHCSKNSAFRIGGEQHKVFNRLKNGMEELCVVVHIGRHVYIDQDRYFLWVELQNTGELEAVVKLIREAKAQGRYLSPEDAVAQVRQRGGAAA